MTSEMRNRCRRTIEKGRRRKERNRILSALWKTFSRWILSGIKAILPFVAAAATLTVTGLAWAVHNDTLFDVMCTLGILTMVLLFAFWAPGLFTEEKPKEKRR